MLQIYYIYNFKFIKILLCHVSQPLSGPLSPSLDMKIWFSPEMKNDLKVEKTFNFRRLEKWKNKIWYICCNF